LLFFLFFGVDDWRKKRALRSIKSSTLSMYKKINLKPDDELKWERLVHFISENYFDPQLNIELLSFKTGISPKSIPSLIQKFMNSNFKGYLNELRLQEAARLLKETDKQITEIAMSVGYNNISHFSRIFKEKFNTSPKDFREKQVS
jgi:AraC-like DNA-binding protein